MTKYYRIQSEDHTFVGILERGDVDNEYEIQVGGTGTRKCSIVHIDTDARTLHISDLFYRERCRALGYLKQGVGTQLLLHASVLIAVALFPKLETLILQDESTFSCDNVWGDTESVPLADYSMLVYGETWYQRKLPGLKPEAKFVDAVDKFQNQLNMGTSTLPFTDFWRSVTKAAPLRVMKYLGAERNLLEKLYDSSATARLNLYFFIGISRFL